MLALRVCVGGQVVSPRASVGSVLVQLQARQHEDQQADEQRRMREREERMRREEEEAAIRAEEVRTHLVHAIV